MDSGNSGSLQSSSGGDEEYDSRAAAHSFFMTRPISTPPPPPPLFDPFSSYAQLHNPITPWPRPASMGSDPNPIIFQAPATAVGENKDLLGAAQNQNPAARNPRKRPRASRRAPTTVLTTDTANFRAKVQEFTGIPAPPFNSSSFPRNRLDLFATRSTAFEAAHLPPPLYLRRPSAQKPNSPPPPPPPFLVSSTASSIASTPINYQLPITQNSNLFNVQNPNTLTYLLQSNPKFLFSNSDVITSKPHDQDSFGIPTSDDQFGLGHHQIHASTTSLNALPNLVSPDQMKNPNYDKNAEETGYHHHQMKTTTASGGGCYGFSNGKMNCPASPPPTSDFRGGKGAENVATRGEGMVESWICSSE